MVTVSMETALLRSAALKWLVLTLYDHTYKPDKRTAQKYTVKAFIHIAVFTSKWQIIVQQGHKGIGCLHKDVLQIRQQKVTTMRNPRHVSKIQKCIF